VVNPLRGLGFAGETLVKALLGGRISSQARLRGTAPLQVIAAFHPFSHPSILSNPGNSELQTPNSELSWTQVPFFDDQHGAWRMFHDSFCGATDKQSFDPGGTMRTDDNQVNFGIVRHQYNLLKWISDT
jgi:hypothetical protein